MINYKKSNGPSPTICNDTENIAITFAGQNFDS